jgi:hypothetical protein
MTLDFKPRMLVRHKTSGKIGVLLPTIYILLSDGDDELSVAYDGETPITLNCEGGRDAFEIVGPENAVPDPQRCGAGQGEHCCVFLTCGPNGFECERHGPLRYTLQFKEMTAKRNPLTLYPECMLVKNPETVAVLWLGTKPPSTS